MISPNLGLLPYIKRKVRKTLAARTRDPIMDATSKAMLAANSQMGISVRPILIITVTGAVKGNRVNTVVIAWSGFGIMKPASMSGITPIILNIPEI